MQVADVGRDFVDDFAVGPQQQPQHAVRAGMLRAHVDQHLVRPHVEFDDAGIFQLHAHLRLTSKLNNSMTKSECRKNAQMT